FDRYQAEPGTGLHLRLHPGRAIAGGTLRAHSTLTNLLLPPNATTYLWQRASGAWGLGTPTPPETTALGPLWLITTDADTITNLQDRRTYATDTVVLHLRGPPPPTPRPTPAPPPSPPPPAPSPTSSSPTTASSSKTSSTASPTTGEGPPAKPSSTSSSTAPPSTPPPPSTTSTPPGLLTPPTSSSK